MRKIILFIIPLLLSCQESLDLYLGIPLQPKFEDESFIPGLNIFGVMRTDNSNSQNNSFVVLQKVVAAVGDSSNWEIDSAQVYISKIIDDSIANIFIFTQKYQDSLSSSKNYLPDSNFSPQPGDIYIAECIYPDLPILYATTQIPNKPELSYQPRYSDNTLYAELICDTSYYMIDTYIYTDNQVVEHQRQVSEQDKNTLLSISTLNSKPDSILIFTYDFNLAEYYLGSNISLNFNKYRTSFSTILNGYGVFGSVNYNVFYPE